MPQKEFFLITTTQQILDIGTCTQTQSDTKICKWLYFISIGTYTVSLDYTK